MSQETPTPDDDEEVDVLDESLDDDEGLYDIGESSLSYFGADFDVNGLVRRLNEEDILIPRFDPDESDGSEIGGFQRQRVWTAPRMEKFIESLLLGWPVPSIFLVLEPDQRYLVLDGQQRLTALQQFYDGHFRDGRPFQLHDVAEHLQGVTYATLNKESRRRLNNTFIQATVIEPNNDEQGRDSVYRLFGRLNSGGISLTPQEIRVALFRGKAVEVVREMNHDLNWRRLFGPPHPRLKDHELILRALALRSVLLGLESNWGDRETELEAYKPPMAETLNSYLKQNAKMKRADIKSLSDAFAAATETLFKADGDAALRFAGRLNAAHVDTVIAVLMVLYERDQMPKPASLRRALAKLRASQNYQGFVTQSTSHRDSVVGRLGIAWRTLGA